MQTIVTESRFQSLQFSCSVVSTLWDAIDCSTPGFAVHHQLPELTQRHVHSQWCHPIISTSVIPFSSCLQSFPASSSFPMKLFASGGQSVGASASAPVFPMNIYDWLTLRWTGLILQSKGLWRVFSNFSIDAMEYCQLWSPHHIQHSHDLLFL